MQSKPRVYYGVRLGLIGNIQMFDIRVAQCCSLRVNTYFLQKTFKIANFNSIENNNDLAGNYDSIL